MELACFLVTEGSSRDDDCSGGSGSGGGGGVGGGGLFFATMPCAARASARPFVELTVCTVLIE